MREVQGKGMSPFKTQVYRTYLPNKRNTRKMIFRRSLAKNKKERQSQSRRRESGKQSNRLLGDCIRGI
jgi:hypothetical protein